MIVELVIGYAIGRSSCQSACAPKPSAVDYRQLELPFPARPRGAVDKVYNVLTLGSFALMQAAMIYWLWDIWDKIGSI